MEPHQPEGWFRRNWAWIVPLGLGCVGCIVLVVGIVAVGAFFTFDTLKSSVDPLRQEALDRVRAHPDIISALGEPIEVGWLFRGHVNVSDSTGEADVEVPISGSKGKGTVYLKAVREDGEWRLERLEIAIEGAEGRIDLLQSGI